jgi:hypothetical protein
MPIPFDVALGFSDGTTDIVHETSAVWQSNLRQTSVTIPARKAVQSVELRTGIWMDADSTNNRWSGRP